MKSKLKIGVINWDAALVQDTYFGGYVINSLGNAKHSHRLPYYAKKDGNGNYFIPERLQEDYDLELTMAADSGIDFFMYCWYPDGTEPRNIGTEKHTNISSHLHELNRMRKLYQKSPLNKRIKMCAIVIAQHAYSENDMHELIFAMKQDYYEKKDGRPLIFVFGGYVPDFFATLKGFAEDDGLNPYIIFINNGKLSENGDYSKADAVSAYASFQIADSFDKFSFKVHGDNEHRKTYGIPVIPLLSAGWNPTPRVERPVPWGDYPERNYTPAPTADEMEAATLDFFKWIDDNSEEASTGYGVIFAWNEFEEGGYLCPTLGNNGEPCSDILDGLGRALKKR